MRANRWAAIGRATAYQTGRVTHANRVEVGDVVYYFSPQVARDAANRISKKLALLWTGPYRVVGKPSESLATLQPMGHWARGDRELTTTVDKLRVVRGPVPEDRLAPQVQVNLDELEEDLDDYGEYICAKAEGAGGPPTPEEFGGDAAGVGGRIGVPEEDGEGREAPEAEPPEREDGTAGQGRGAATGRTDPLDGGEAGEAGTGTGPRREGETVPGPSGLGPTKGPATQREAPCSPAPDSEGDVCMEPEPRGPMTKGAQRRALLAEALLRRGASFRHLLPLLLPWRGSRGDAPTGAEGEIAKERGRNPLYRTRQGRPLSPRKWTRTPVRRRCRFRRTRR